MCVCVCWYSNLYHKHTPKKLIPQTSLRENTLHSTALIYPINVITVTMITPSDLRKEIEERLKSYLSRDKSGIRKALLGLIVKMKTVTVPEIHATLSAAFEVSIHSVASMVGTIASKFGILSMKKAKDGDLAVYELKPQYAELVERVISSA